ncbi:ABC transporter substrate-binding protein [Cohnella silvisoli]|uniref:Extracellular solute-binding protein n=1 Tax=Cohnella silvisoli TaxID=2873699 RepID=A0ABV1KW53_9BACL|nr:extracellular solute-binding protein [Cohnella silvisoli]MCD9023737.1 extracellular solute-binding protein [Cohnella silvisoli]
MKRWLALSSAVLLMMAILAACGGNNGNSASESASPSASGAASEPSASAQDSSSGVSDEAFTLSIGYWIDDVNGYFNAVTSKFKEKYPNAEIKLNKQPGDKYGELLATKLAAGQGDDIIFNQAVKEFAKAGYLVDLSEQPWVSRMNATAKNAVTYQGKQYGAVYETNTFGVYYNKKIFSEQGLTPPKTWDEFIQLGEKLLAAGITPVVGGFKDAWTIGGPWISIGETSFFAKNPNFEIDIYHGKSKINGPEIQDALERFKEMTDKGFWNKNALSIGYDQSVQEFIDGKAAMHIMGSWTPGVVDSKTKEMELGFFPIPGRNGEIVMSAGVDKQIGINTNSANVEKSKELLSLMLSKEMLELYSKNVALTAFTDVNPEYSLSGMTETQAALSSADQLNINVGDRLTNSARDSLNKALSLILAGIDYKPALEEAERNYEKDKGTLNPDDYPASN